jgi:hypothetical protein
VDPFRWTWQSGLPGNTGLYFTLQDDSFENAQKVADFLNDSIDKIGVTIFKEHPMFASVKGL